MPALSQPPPPPSPPPLPFRRESRRPFEINDPSHRIAMAARAFPTLWSHCVILLPRGEKYESHKDPAKTGDDDCWDRNDRYKLASKCINVRPEMGFGAAFAGDLTFPPEAYDSLHPRLGRLAASILDRRPANSTGESIFERSFARSIEGERSRSRKEGRDGIEVRIARYQGACCRVRGPADPFVHDKSIIAR